MTVQHGFVGTKSRVDSKKNRTSGSKIFVSKKDSDLGGSIYIRPNRGIDGLVSDRSPLTVLRLMVWYLTN